MKSRASVTGAGFPATEPITMKRTRHSFSSMSTTRSSSWGSLQGSRHRDSISGRWVDDAEAGDCRKCERPFTLINRRHHCRICGHIFCNQCSRTRMMIATPLTETAVRQRVCDPCALQAQSNAILYDLDDISEIRTRRLSHVSTEDSSEFLSDTTTTIVPSPSNLSTPEPSVSFMAASMFCFATSFWFLKDEVSRSNPAIWILLAGFLKNLYQLIVSLRTSQPMGPLLEPIKQESHVTIKHHEVIHTSEPIPEKTQEHAYPQEQAYPFGWNETKTSEVINSAKIAANAVYELAISNGSEWTPELPSFEISDVTLSSREGKPARIYKCEATFDVSAEKLFDILHTQFATSYAWNITAAENRIVETLNDDTDIVHITSAPALGGMIASRDFINVRTWRKKDDVYIIGSVCVGDLFAPVKGVTRGENGHTGFIIRPHATSPSKSHMTWVLNCDIKGYFPGSMIKKGSLSELCCFVRNLRRHIAVTIGSASCNTVSIS